MIKMFKYEFKKNLKATIIISVILLAITLLILSNSSFVGIYDYSRWLSNKWNVYENLARNYAYIVDTGKEFHYPSTPPLNLFVIYGISLSFIYAIIEFKFKTKKVEIDAMYSLPIKRRSLYLAKFLNGFTNILIPVIGCYLITVLYIACSYNLYNMWGFLLYLPILILFIFLAYSVFAFAFTRGNNVADGIVTIIFIVSLTLMIEAFRELTEILYDSDRYSDGYETIFAPFVYFSGLISDLICHKSSDFVLKNNYWNIINIILSVACFVLFVVLIDNEKAEDAENRTDSWFSYKVFLPLYNFILISICESLLLTVIFAAATYFIYVYKNKSFKIKTHELITLLVSTVLGLLVAIYVEETYYSGSPVNYTAMVNFLKLYF